MMRFLAHLFSTLFHPFLMATCGVLIALNCTLLKYTSLLDKVFLLLGTFFFSALLPALTIFILMKIKWISDYEVDKKEERLLPYLIMILSLVATLSFFVLLSAPYWLVGLMGGMAVAVCIAALINNYWKISAHGIGVGGLTGTILCITPHLTTDPLYLFIPALLASGCTGSSRILLGRHTFGQVIGGILLGLFFSAAGVLVSHYLL
jgi:membrane-associated phospholipid phosphatase